MPDEIVLPVTEPETEWVRGRALRKVSPRRDHARVQLVFGAMLDRWAHGRGEVGTEWRFRVAVPGEPRRPLVPHIAFVERERIAALTDEELQSPALAPDVAVEILSPSDDLRDVADKIAVYLQAGTLLVVAIDPAARTIVLHDGGRVASFSGAGRFEHAALPGLSFVVGMLFDEALARR